MKKSWGVRREIGIALDRVERSTNPIEEIIAKDIRELKEREEAERTRAEQLRKVNGARPFFLKNGCYLTCGDTLTP